MECVICGTDDYPLDENTNRCYECWAQALLAMENAEIAKKNSRSGPVEPGVDLEMDIIDHTEYANIVGHLIVDAGEEE